MTRVGDMDPDAFELVYDRHSGAAYSLAYRICGDRTAADDVLQEAFMSVWRSGSRYAPTLGSVRSWILSITHNRAIDFIRRAIRHESRQVYDDSIAERLAAASDTEATALGRQSDEETRTLLNDLSPDQRKVIELSFYGGFSHSEISDLLRVPLGTVKGRMRLGLAKLKVSLNAGVG